MQAIDPSFVTLTLTSLMDVAKNLIFITSYDIYFKLLMIPFSI